MNADCDTDSSSGLILGADWTLAMTRVLCLALAVYALLDIGARAARRVRHEWKRWRSWTLAAPVADPLSPQSRKRWGTAHLVALGERQGYRCMGWSWFRCGQLLPRPWNADHIRPLSEGGADCLENLQLLCGNCHDRKSSLERTVV